MHELPNLGAAYVTTADSSMPTLPRVVYVPFANAWRRGRNPALAPSYDRGVEPDRRVVDIGALRLTLWGPPSDGVLVTVHGKQSHQCDADILMARDRSLSRGEQVLAWDLPGHGDRPGSPADCRITDAVRELDQVWAWTAQHYTRCRVFATSLGAYLTLVTAPQDELQDAQFLSPVVDMVGLVHALMDAFTVTPQHLRERGRVDTPVEPLEWDQYEFITDHPVLPWIVPTRILHGSHDELVAAESVAAFCEQTGAQLTTSPGSAHHFHTDADLTTLNRWLAG